MVREFLSRSGSATSLAVTMVLAACSDAPTAARLRAPLIEHGDIITIVAEPNAGAVVVSPDQEIVIGEGEDAIVARFHSNLHIGSDGTATGTARLVYDLPDGDGTRRVVFVVSYTGAVLDVSGGTFVARVEGNVEVCSGAECRTFPIAGTISPEPGDDCLIYDILGPDVHDGEALEADGRLIIPG
jgi:hypothetical protein